MRKAVLYVLVVILVAGYGNWVSVAQESQGKATAPQGGLRWHGTIVRWSKDQSTLDVRKETVTKTIHYDSSTKWTQTVGGKSKPAEMSEFTEGSDVICLGKAGEDKSFVATQIDLRTKAQKP